MGGIVHTGNVTHDNNVLLAEAKRQASVAAATNQAGANAAEVTYNQTCLASALANGVQSEVFRVALRQLGMYV